MGVYVCASVFVYVDVCVCVCVCLCIRSRGVGQVVVTVGSEPSLQLQKVKEKDCYVLLCKPYMLSLQQHVLISEIRRPF